jgi:hypothetical protein
MTTLEFVLAAFLDPVQAGIVLALLLMHRGPQPVAVAGVLAALFAETAMALAADAYSWGELIAPRLLSSLMQAAVLVWTGRLLQAVRATGARGGASGHRAAFGSLDGGGALGSRPALWQSRAYIKRRFNWLRFR